MAEAEKLLEIPIEVSEHDKERVDSLKKAYRYDTKEAFKLAD